MRFLVCIPALMLPAWSLAPSSPTSPKWNGATRALERFTLIPFEELQPSGKRAYLVKGLVPRVGLTVIWGAPKCFKSFWTYDLAMHIALGREYRGRRVHQGPVVYCAFEGADGYNARAEAFRRRRLDDDQDPIPFHLIGARVDLIADAPDLIAIGRRSA